MTGRRCPFLPSAWCLGAVGIAGAAGGEYR